MKHDIQAKIFEEIEDMTVEERIAYFRRGGDEFRREMASEDAPVVREVPPAYCT